MNRIQRLRKHCSRFAAIAIMLAFSAQLSLAQTTVTGADGVQVRIYDTSRIITLGGDVTETVFALGAGDRVVAVDASSNFPAEVNNLPKVPYVRQLTAEGILSLSPTLIISTEGAEPKNVIKQIRAAGMPILMVSDSPTPEGAIAKIETIGKAL
ncbi:MAG: ABC transporter substrate-binding protein, partial [Bacteroidetes bacterium]|nr:ABC transporter substrate-binding protein [Bacteroidota bacterium]